MILIEKVLNTKGKNILPEVKVGSKFYTPNDKPQESKSARIIYSSTGIKKKS